MDSEVISEHYFSGYWLYSQKRVLNKDINTGLEKSMMRKVEGKTFICHR